MSLWATAHWVLQRQGSSMNWSGSWFNLLAIHGHTWFKEKGTKGETKSLTNKLKQSSSLWLTLIVPFYVSLCLHFLAPLMRILEFTCPVSSATCIKSTWQAVGSWKMGQRISARKKPWYLLSLFWSTIWT